MGFREVAKLLLVDSANVILEELRERFARR
jgi:hypothetical protein